jgi:V/A-type H+/Na+-transporting ATPase subunit D
MRRSAATWAKKRMPDSGEVAATRVALLELRDERRLVQEGYELLDEKRVMLATEILRELRAHEAAQTALDRLWLEAREALAGAVEMHGFEDLTVEPPCLLDTVLLRQTERSFLGLRLAEASLDAAPCVPASRPVRSTPELKRCAGTFRQLTGELVAQAARAANLRRLIEEYRRTERRARALENVLLPEIDHSLKFIEEQLDAVDQEEAVRVRNAARGR